MAMVRRAAQNHALLDYGRLADARLRIKAIEPAPAPAGRRP